MHYKQNNNQKHKQIGFWYSLLPIAHCLLPSKKRGALLVPVLVFGAVAAIMLAGLVQWVGTNVRLVRSTANRELAFQIAESGLEYYRWHLAHSPGDFQDGTGMPGPYVHVYRNKDGVAIGQFLLTITPPVVGSTMVRIRSEGTVRADVKVKRVLETTLAIPSLAKFAIVNNNSFRIGQGTEVFGPIHTNGGVRFDGLAHNLVSSALASYKDPDHAGSNEFGVHTHMDPLDPVPPAAVPNRAAIFQAGRQFPVPAVSFGTFTTDLQQLSTLAQQNGRYFDASQALGYRLVLKTNDTFDLYKVLTTASLPNGCPQPSGQTGWGSWSVQTQSFIGNYTVPANGVVFLADHTWVEGAIDGVRITIAVGHFPENQGQGKSITVNNNLLYTRYDGTDVIGLIAQENVNVGLVSADTLRVDGAIVAKNGRAGRYYYKPPDTQNRCAPYHARRVITLYGALVSNTRYGFAYTDGTGYGTRNIIYDPNLLYGPPPSFPLTSDQYSALTWREVKN